MEFKELYKARRVPKLSDILAKRSENYAAERREKQRELFWRKRNVEDDFSSVKKSKFQGKTTNSRAEMLAKWKAEKLKKLEDIKKKKKPIFKVGIMQTKATGSPILNKNTLPGKQNFTTKNKGYSGSSGYSIMTRSKVKALATSGHRNLNTDIKLQQNLNEKKQFCNVNVGVLEPLQSYKFKVPKSVVELKDENNLMCPKPLKMMCESKQENELLQVKGEKIKQKGPKKLEAEKLDGVITFERSTTTVQNELDKITDPDGSISVCQTCDDDDYRPIHYSPFVTKRQEGKSKRQRRSKLKVPLNVDEEIKKEEDEFQCRIFSFKKYIQCETKRLLDKCDHWKTICADTKNLPCEIVGEICSVTGKTNLLTSDKFKQFKSLIEKCEAKDPLIKADDLQGFQDWVSIEVERIDKDFCQLEERMKNNWVLDIPQVDVPTVQRSKQIIEKKIKKPVVKSKIRDHIEALRRGAKAESNTNSPLSKTPSIKVLSKTNEIDPKGRRITSQYGPEKQNSGLEIMLASQKSKINPANFPEETVNDSVIKTKLAEVPTKGILRESCNTPRTPKNRVTFKAHSEAVVECPGLAEKYFKPAVEDVSSPFRLIDANSPTHNGRRRVSTRSTQRIIYMR